MHFGGRKRTPLNTRLAASGQSGRPVNPTSHGPGRADVALGDDWPRLTDTEPMPPLAPPHIPGPPLADVMPVAINEVACRLNCDSIYRIPRELLCAGKRGVLWSLAYAGEHVRAVPPNAVNPHDWYLCLWGQWARLPLCGVGEPLLPGDYSGNVEDYRPRPLALSTYPRSRVPTGRMIR